MKLSGEMFVVKENGGDCRLPSKGCGTRDVKMARPTYHTVEGGGCIPCSSSKGFESSSAVMAWLLEHGVIPSLKHVQGIR
jgi:hypothetical protein